jgi:hypothetical protein
LDAGEAAGLLLQGAPGRPRGPGAIGFHGS